MSNKASSLKSQIEEFSRRQGIAGEMDQNLVKEAIHLHLLSAMSDAGILRHAVFQGGTALRLCYGGDRYSEDLYFVCGKAGSYFTDVEFKELIEAALETTKKTLNRDFGIAADRISLKKPPHPDLVKLEPITVAAWQIIVPIEAITDLPPGGRLPLGAVENIARIAALDPSRRRTLLDEVAAGRLTIDQVALELEKTRKRAKRRAAEDPLGLVTLAIDELKARGVDLKDMSLFSFDEWGDVRYFDSQTRPAFVIRIPEKPPIVVMDGRQFGGTAASFMRQRKEFLRNVLVAAGLYETVLVYAPHWHEDVARLIRHARPAVGARIVLMGDPETPEEAVVVDSVIQT